MKIAAEADLNPIVADPGSLARRVLVFAPHPDDEVFGCGGTLGLLAAAGADITVVVVSDGALGGNSPGLVEGRENESRAAAQVLGYPPPTFWRLPDRGIRYGETLVIRMLAAITSAQADLVFAPAISEIHPDHQAVALAAGEALRRLGGNTRLAWYEISAPLLPNTVVDIGAVEARKLAAMQCFHSQLVEQPYAERIAALNRYRAYHLGPRATAAEAFAISDAAGLAQGCSPLFDSVPARRRRLGFAADGGDIPLVSVIVRSMDRATLGEALDSLALQTYDNLEVVVVNAKGGQHRDPGEHCGRFPLRIVNQGGTPLTRPQAGNAGLDAAQGQYLSLLDDDDTLDPDHLSHLVAALQSEAGAIVAYAGVRCIDRSAGGRTVSRIFGEQVDSTAQLLAGNFIPIHAPLFPRHLLTHARFDETLETYEDWDFWLQLMQVARFVYVNRVTATYFTGGNSGVSPLAPDWDAVRHAYGALHAKWIRIVPHEFKAICDLYHSAKAELLASRTEEKRLARLVHETDARLDAALARLDDNWPQDARERIAILERDLAEIRRQRDIAEFQVQDLLSSSSWSITRPLRLLKTVANRLLGRRRRAE
ncbi:MAG: PIG-L family deacetylase [Sterolibacterium sp.]|jgi:LmbE family N-acetylglucosaminyl deacetylase/glycosyltransferase involved in cell wall biosynthesis